MNLQQTIGRLSERYDVSAEAVATLAEAMRQGGNRMAQFNHPELGGYGQWLPGMAQIGDMFNRELRTRVECLCLDLSHALEDGAEGKIFAAGTNMARDNYPYVKHDSTTIPMEPMKPMKPMTPMHGSGSQERWWPENLGDAPNSAGGQNEMRYVYFADRNRLAVDEGGGKITVYDTAGHKVSGVQQHQSGGSKKLVFSSERGEMDLGSLKQV